MCRVVAYLGEPITLSGLLYDSDCSLVHQVYDPVLYQYLNLGGTGIAAWDPGSPAADRPLIYRSTALPMYDRNLVSLARKSKAGCLLAHVRGTDYFEEGAQLVAEPNVHPFQYDGYPVALAHNGGLHRFREMKHSLLNHIDPTVASLIEGTTDSEWIYAVLLTQLAKQGEPVTAERIGDAVFETFRCIREVRRKHGIEVASGVNLFVSDGRSLVVTRFAFDFGCYEGVVNKDQLAYHSLWYTAGDAYGKYDGQWRMGADGPLTSVLVASEPLTSDDKTWVEVPEYTMLMASREHGRLITVHACDIDV